MNQRRPNSRELNPEDLFRPEPAPQHDGGAYGYPGPQGGTAQGQPGYPAAVPGQDAAATQYLPPYPTTDPAAGPGGAAPGVPEAATQYLPPYPAADPAPGPGGAAPGVPEAATQYLPPYPAADPAAAPAATAQYAPARTPAQYSPAAPTAPYGAPQGFPPQAPYGAQHGGYLQQQMAYDLDEEPSGGSRRPSGKVIAGMVVGACALVGILTGALLSGGGSGKAEASTTGTTTAGSATPSTGTAAAPSSGTKADSALQSQAQALSQLLGTASSSRGAVVSAVASITRCQDLPAAQQDLRQAAQQRRRLVAGLAGLQVDKLPNGAQLSAQLKAAWEASARADEEYAAWAAQSDRSCRKHHRPAPGGHYAQGTAASGTATAAKQQASSLWNAIAGQTGLPTRAATQL